jgi:hypothetical protein
MVFRLWDGLLVLVHLVEEEGPHQIRLIRIGLVDWRHRLVVLNRKIVLVAKQIELTFMKNMLL